MIDKGHGFDLQVSPFDVLWKFGDGYYKINVNVTLNSCEADYVNKDVIQAKFKYLNAYK